MLLIHLCLSYLQVKMEDVDLQSAAPVSVNLIDFTDLTPVVCLEKSFDIYHFSSFLYSQVLNLYLHPHEGAHSTLMWISPQIKCNINILNNITFMNLNMHEEIWIVTFIFFQLPPVHQPKPVITPRWIIPTTAVSLFVFWLV